MYIYIYGIGSNGREHEKPTPSVFLPPRPPICPLGRNRALLGNQRKIWETIGNRRTIISKLAILLTYIDPRSLMVVHAYMYLCI